VSSPGSEKAKGRGRFLLQRPLGVGSFGTVFEAFDRERQSVVALKVLRRAEPEALYHFKHEFRALADLVHPNLVALYELLVEGEEWFFTMELVRGTDFRSWVRPGSPTRATSVSDEETTARRPLEDTARPLPPTTPFSSGSGSDAEEVAPPPALVAPLRLDRLARALHQLAEGLQALHEAGKLHRDVKPSNVLVTDEGRVKILDFGMVLELGPTEDERSGQVVGTPAYMAPEQAVGKNVTTAADWYSVGVLLHEALTGRVPSRRAPPGPERHPGVPEDLDALCAQLLQPIALARPTGPEVLSRLAAVMAGSPPATVLPRPAPASRAPLVGRERHLAALLDALRASQRGRAIVTYLHGPSGAGKTVLLRRFAEEVQQTVPDAVLLSGRCYQQEWLPYEALDSVVDNLSQYMKRLPAAEAAALTPLDGSALARLFPVLLQVPAIADTPRKVEARDSRELRRRAFGALRELLSRLANRKTVVLIIDDLQWGDLDSAALLLELLRPPEPPPLLLVAAYRSEDAASSPLLRTLLAPEVAQDCAAEFRTVIVNELPPEQARELAFALLERAGRAPAEVAGSIAEESLGNPFLIHELVRSLDLEGGETDRAGAAMPARLEAVIERRVARLPQEARRLLEIVAVAGYPLPRAVARHAARLEEDEPASVALLRAGRLIRTRGRTEGEQVETYHDRIRETVAQGLSPEELRERHRALAVSLEAAGPVDPERLAIHLQGAGEATRAGRLFAEAAGRAAEAVAFDHAARLFRQALELGSWEAEEARRLRQRLGEALGNAGRGAEAAGAYLEAARIGGADRDASVELYRRAAEQFFRSGHVDAGLATLRTVLDAVGLRFPATPRSALAELLLRRLQFRLRGLRFRERRATELPPQTLVRIDACWAAAIGLGFVDTVRGAVFQIRGLLLALSAGEPARVARALAVESAYSSTGGGRTRGKTERLSRLSLDLAGRLDNPQALGIAMVTNGIVAHFEGRWRDCREILERAEALLREHSAGVAFEMDNAAYCRLFSLYSLGELRELAAVLPALVKDAQERGDIFSLTNLRVRVAYVARLVEDDVPGARRELDRAMEEWSHQGFHNQHWWNLLGRAQVSLYAGEATAAWRLVDEGWSTLTRTFVLRIQLISVLARSLRGRCALAASAGAEDRKRLLAVTERDAAAIEAERMPWAEPLAVLLRAGVAARRGRIEEAGALLATAEAGFERADMALYAAAARRRRGELVGGDEGRRAVEAADTWMAGQAVRNPERMTAMLAG
jgi:serine/threonine protein kinase/tetratricopeptide (TPR) repeat protein